MKIKEKKKSHLQKTGRHIFDRRLEQPPGVDEDSTDVGAHCKKNKQQNKQNKQKQKSVERVGRKRKKHERRERVDVLRKEMPEARLWLRSKGSSMAMGRSVHIFSSRERGCSRRTHTTCRSDQNDKKVDRLRNRPRSRFERGNHRVHPLFRSSTVTPRATNRRRPSLACSSGGLPAGESRTVRRSRGESRARGSTAARDWPRRAANGATGS